MPNSGLFIPRIGQTCGFATFASNKKNMKPFPEIFDQHARLYTGFITDAEALFHTVTENTDWDTRMQARRTASYGVAYDYSGISYPQMPMPAYLEKICHRLEELLGFLPNNCLLNDYPDGTSTMGYHSDQTDVLEEATGIAIVSLGGARELRFKNKADKTQIFGVVLEPGSIFYMDQHIQTEWLHAIPGDPDAGRRISLTFRQMKL